MPIAGDKEEEEEEVKENATIEDLSGRYIVADSQRAETHSAMLWEGGNIAPPDCVMTRVRHVTV